MYACDEEMTPAECHDRFDLACRIPDIGNPL